jgi:hypothetical protein
MFENRGLRRIFGSKRDEVTGGWRKLHNEEFHTMHSSASIIRMVKSRMRWEGYVARMGRRVMHIGYWCEKQKERDLRSTITNMYHLGWYNRPVVAAVPSGLILTPLRIKKE